MVPPSEVRRQVERILASGDFDASPRSRDFLTFVVEEALAGRGEAITQTAIATRVFQRRPDFDATTDPIVRIQAGHLRRSLERYYLLSGKQDGIRIELPKGRYAPVFGPGPGGTSDPQATDVFEDVAPDDWPSVVLGPFETTGEQASLADIARRLSEALSGELGAYMDVRVMVRAELEQLGPLRRAAVRFGLAGRFREEAGGPRATVRLVDRSTGAQLWQQEYQASTPGPVSDDAWDEVGRVIAARVASEEGVIVQRLAGERRARTDAPATPYDAILRSYDFFLVRDPADFAPALEALRRVTDRVPDCGLAWTRLGRMYAANYVFEVSPVSTPIDEAIRCAQQGVRLDAESRRARTILGQCLLVRGELEAAREELDQALRLAPRSFAYLEIIGWLLALTGDWERGTGLARSAQARNPHGLPHFAHAFWLDHLRRGDYAAAHAAAFAYRDRGLFWRAAMRASALGLLGREAEAAPEVADVLAIKPGFRERGRVLLSRYVKQPELLELVVTGLRKAGLPVE